MPRPDLTLGKTPVRGAAPVTRLLKTAHSRLLGRYGVPRNTRKTPYVMTETDLEALSFGASNSVTPMLVGITGPMLTNGLWDDDGTETVYVYNGAAGLSVACDNNIYVFRLNNDKTLTELGNYDHITSADSAASGTVQVDARGFVDGWRDDGGTYPCYIDGFTLGNAAFSANATQISAGVERYHHATCYHVGIALVRNTSNTPYQGMEQVIYAEGQTGTMTDSAKTEGNATNPSIFPAVVGGPGDGMRKRYDPLQTYPKYTWVSGHYSDGNAQFNVDADAVTIDLLHGEWDGTTNDGAMTITETAGAIVLPAASGETDRLIPTSWGNALVHMDSEADPGSNTGGLVPITWSGSTPTAEPFMDWPYKDRFNISGIHWGLVGTRSNGFGPHTLGEYDGDDQFRTIYSHTDGTDLFMDTIKLKIQRDGSVSIETIHRNIKQAVGVTALNVGFGPQIVNKGRDLMWINTSESPHTFRYLAHAWGD